MTSEATPPWAQPGAGGGQWITVGSARSLITGGQFHGNVYMGAERDVLPTVPIDQAEVEYCQATFVDHSQVAEARAVLETQSAVALLGSTGCGRRTTGTVLLASLRVVPHRVVLDAEDLGRQLEIAPSNGYLLDLDEDLDQLTPKVGIWISRLVTQIRAANSLLVVRAPERSWHALGLSDQAMRTTHLMAPPARVVFRSHLAATASAAVAEVWTQSDPVGRHLAAATPSDGVRMAKIVARTIAAHVPEDRQLDQVISEYTNWAEKLATWFRDTTGPVHGYKRALLLAAAALEGAPAGTVFAAADGLAAIVGLAPEPGGALAGPDASDLVSQVEAELRGASVEFGRPAYGTSVLDHVWSERPQLHKKLRDWLTAIPGSGDEGSGRAARALTNLAIRQHDANLVSAAARQWAEEPATRQEFSVPELTHAALSEEIGRDVRRQLYEWARTSAARDTTHLAVAAVCAGPLARQYPQIALTRLRNLVMRPNPIVQASVFESLATLAGESALYPSVVSELTRWVNEEEPRGSAGLRAFLRLANPGEDGQIAVLARAPVQDTAALADLWRAALRDSRQDGVANAAAQLVSRWLDEAAQGRAPREPVLGVLAGSCQSSVDVGRMAAIAFDGVGPRDSNPARYDIAVELVQRTWQRDPVYTGRRAGQPS
jgi:hypothetical protein